MEYLNKEQLRVSLADVRKAYRLLYLYQRRVKDLIEYIGNQYSMQLDSGWSKFSNPAPNGKRVKLEKWAWDWLNMYLYQFAFTPVKVNGDDVFFAIVLQSDTGFYDANDSHTKLDVSNFADPQESTTRLIFVAAKNDRGCAIEKLLKGHLNKEEKEFADGDWIGKAYEMEEFIDEESTNKILNDFDEYCREKLNISMR